VPVPTVQGDGMGLFFGGGAQSLYALSQLESFRPTLLSLGGEQWMNHGGASGNARNALMRKLAADRGLPLVEITTNARALVNRSIGHWCSYVGGPAFYFIALPVALALNIGVLVQEYELEYVYGEAPVAERGLSMSPFTQHLLAPDGPWPKCISPHTAIPAVQMVEELADTPFLDYLYSCFTDSSDGQRWCGKCPKCRRYAAYLDRLGIPRSRVGMGGNVPAMVSPEGQKGMATNYWRLFTDLYPPNEKGAAPPLPREENTQAADWQFPDRVLAAYSLLPPVTGAGTHRLLDAASARHRQDADTMAALRGYQLTVCDVRPRGPGVEMQNVESLTYADGAFAGAVSTDTFEHVHDVNRALRELARVTAPHGFLIASVPVYRNAKGEHMFKTKPGTGKFMGHVWHFGLDFGDRLQTCGWRIIGRLLCHVPERCGVTALWLAEKQ